MKNPNKRKQTLLVAVLSFFLISSGSSLWGKDSKPNLAVSKDIMVPMRDGVKLATDVYFPTQNGKVLEGKFPVDAICGLTPCITTLNIPHIFC